MASPWRLQNAPGGRPSAQAAHRPANRGDSRWGRRLRSTTCPGPAGLVRMADPDAIAALRGRDLAPLSRTPAPSGTSQEWCDPAPQILDQAVAACRRGMGVGDPVVRVIDRAPRPRRSSSQNAATGVGPIARQLDVLHRREAIFLKLLGRRKRAAIGGRPSTPKRHDVRRGPPSRSSSGPNVCQVCDLDHQRRRQFARHPGRARCRHRVRVGSCPDRGCPSTRIISCT